MLVKCNATSARTICIADKNPKKKPHKVTIVRGETREVDDDLMARAMKKPVVAGWFEGGELVNLNGVSGQEPGLDEGLVKLTGTKAPDFAAAGFGTVDAIANASEEDLRRVDGIGEAKAKEFHEQAQEIATAGE